ncbi:HNH endonuclease [Shewanella sp. AS16]|uniref:HNH endonuclease n=1 Tax=Shewanella sp. AS16 TaxID=2907625 RepID=UPI001F483DED|nr:HNH endonuclease [Shewanella sp. AS16]MCE9687916.1 HNH endonuclease [Shewanella sp. AS16]
MTERRSWTRDELLVAFHLYNQTPFGKISHRNPEIINTAKLMGRTPSSLSMKMANIASCDPSITASGRSGLSGAAKADREMWQEMTRDWENFYFNASEAFNKISKLQSPEAVNPDPSLELDDFHGPEKLAIIKTRVGQQQFRAVVLSAYDFRCCITGIDIPELLIASHIVPWSRDPQQRLNPSNGLCLSRLHDAAFDKGLISLNEHLELMLSPKLLNSNNDYLASSFEPYEGKPITNPSKHLPNPIFLQHHRSEIFHKQR